MIFTILRKAINFSKLQLYVLMCIPSINCDVGVRYLTGIQHHVVTLTIHLDVSQPYRK